MTPLPPRYSPARILDSTTAVCTVPELPMRPAPPWPSPGPTSPAAAMAAPPPHLASAVRLTVNAEARALSAPLPYLVYRDATLRLRAASPSAGPTRGNTSVEVPACACG